MSTFAGGGAAMEFGELDGSFSMTGYSGDTMGLFGTNQDFYGTIYKKAAAGDLFGHRPGDGVRPGRRTVQGRHRDAQRPHPGQGPARGTSH